MIIIALALIAAGTDQPVKASTKLAVITAVKRNLTDPDSAKITNIRQTGPNSYCGWVNAKNAFGGYAGDQLFYDVGGFVQIFGSRAVFETADITEQVRLIASGDSARAMAIKPRLSAEGKKVEPCLKGYHGD